MGEIPRPAMQYEIEDDEEIGVLLPQYQHWWTLIPQLNDLVRLRGLDVDEIDVGVALLLWLSFHHAHKVSLKS